MHLCPADTADDLLDLSLPADLLGLSEGPEHLRRVNPTWRPDATDPPKLALSPQQGSA